MPDSRPFDVAIIGGGIAGLSVALRLPEHIRVALFTKGQIGESNTRYAQGGLSVALGADDSPDLHFQDTIAAGAGLCDEEAVRILVERGPSAARWLVQMGVVFDRAEPGSSAHATPDGLLLGREGAHSRWRVLHAGGDATGAEIERALTDAVRSRASIQVFEETFVQDVVLRDGTCVGLQALDRSGKSFLLEARATVLANGGAGGLWLHTSNPKGATADGLALAWRAGAALSDLEFMQFHPTVLVANGSSHLISEAARGEGAYLLNHAGERFMPRYSEQAELAPRDVVARAILNEMLHEQTDCQYLDLRHLPADRVYTRFPTISAFCRMHGLDMARDLLPIAPAAHYCMGGVMVDTLGRTTVQGLYAVGEVACTGVHGANRLASNSLLEGLVYGLRVADALPALISGDAVPADSASFRHAMTFLSYTHATQSVELSSGSAEHLSWQQVRREARQVMWRSVSLLRDERGLLEARDTIRSLQSALLTNPSDVAESQSPRRAETLNMLLAAELVIAAALQRHESRGSHWRLDYQSLDDTLSGRHFAFQRANIDRYESKEPHEEVFSREF
ncbi:MAG TPA: L-aspartate oxidase [Ktedonobacteraceae bacterium]|jgi:L-aspartate oxidase|nr:L-aspartate oxidase [Ktedonobacteraceae bacterium]